MNYHYRGLSLSLIASNSACQLQHFALLQEEWGDKRLSETPAPKMLFAGNGPLSVFNKEKPYTVSGTPNIIPRKDSGEIRAHVPSLISLIPLIFCLKPPRPSRHS